MSSIKGQYVWYASYGSNLNRDRFLCYIRGGRPKGSEKIEVGCKDPALPIKETTYIMHYPMYFAKESRRWQKQGVAFIGLQKDEKITTYSRMYLITEEQFKDVVKQENNGVELPMNLDEIMQKGTKTLRDTWYGTILYLGKEESYPIFTFTADWDLDVPIQKPSNEYLTMIITGLKNTLQLENTDIINYISSKPGVKGHYSKSELEKLLDNLC